MIFLLASTCLLADASSAAQASDVDQPLHLAVLYPKDTQLDHLKVWNYNQYNCEGLGAKHARVHLNSQPVWEGDVPKVRVCRYSVELVLTGKQRRVCQHSSSK